LNTDKDSLINVGPVHRESIWRGDSLKWLHLTCTTLNSGRRPVTGRLVCSLSSPLNSPPSNPLRRVCPNVLDFSCTALRGKCPQTGNILLLEIGKRLTTNYANYIY
jgi:hypothetical protein